MSGRNRKTIDSAHTIEAAWEVCNQIGGIYTVIRTKAASMLEMLDHQRYLLAGPYIPAEADAVVDPCGADDSVFGQALFKLRQAGYTAVYGTWLVSGRPRVILIDPESCPYSKLEIQQRLQKLLGRTVSMHDSLMRNVARFCLGLADYCQLVAEEMPPNSSLIAHFHEWMTGLAIPLLDQASTGAPGSTASPPSTGAPATPASTNKVRSIFTTHATLLGRYLAMNTPNFYDRLATFDWQKEAHRFGIETEVCIERTAAQKCCLFSTVSELTAKECTHLLGRSPEVLLPNGINSSRFEALHEFQNLHKDYKQRIHTFVMGHFFRHSTIDLENTLYFFTSGRYEFRNKGFDLTIDALRLLNDKMKQAKSPVRVVVFFITRAPYQSINPLVLESRAMLEELRSTCDAIAEEVRQRLLYRALTEPSHRMPDLNTCVDDYYRLRLRRGLQSWHQEELPYVTTHNMQNDDGDQILQAIRRVKLFNYSDDPVKLVYHPDFISQISPLLPMEYAEFVRGCHLGIFPSYYEPWGYTPLECISSGIPAVTTNLSGFGGYVEKNIKQAHRQGIFILGRIGKSYEENVENLADMLFKFTRLSRRERIELRNRTEAGAPLFDWNRLIQFYSQAYNMVLTDTKNC